MTDQTADVQFGRPFVLVRDTDVSGVSGTGVVANGIQWPDGQAAIHWTGSTYPTTTPHPGGMESVTAVHGHGGATHVFWEPGAIPQAEYSSVWPELVGWVQAAHEDGKQIEPVQLLEYLRELKHRALVPVREWMAGIRDAARQTAGQPAARHSADVCPGFPEQCRNIRLVPAEPTVHLGGIRCGCADEPAAEPTVADIQAMLHRMHAAAGLPAPAAGQPDPTIADDPTPLRWGLGDVLYGDDGTITVCMSGPDREPYWLELDPDQAAVLDEYLAGPEGPVVEQPIEACPECIAPGACSGRCFAGPPAAGRQDTQTTTACGCGEPETPGAVHRPGKPCYVEEDAAGRRDTQPTTDGSSVRNVIERALTTYYQDSTAPSAIARAMLAQHDASVLNGAAQAYESEADELDRAAQEPLDPDMARDAKRLRGFAASLRSLAAGDES